MNRLFVVALVVLAGNAHAAPGRPVAALFSAHSIFSADTFATRSAASASRAYADRLLGADLLMADRSWEAAIRPHSFAAGVQAGKGSAHSGTAAPLQEGARPEDDAIHAEPGLEARLRAVPSPLLALAGLLVTLAWCSRRRRLMRF